MGNKIKISILIFILTGVIYSGFGQGNPGFLGKKIAVGYSGQYCLLKTGDIIEPPKNASLAQILLNNDIYFEYSISKYRSLAAHITYQKVPVISDGGSRYGSEVLIGQNMTISGKQTLVFFNRRAGIADFRLFGLGVRYTMYSYNKTIASPIGLGHYLRLDIFSNKAENNNYAYNIANDYPSNLTDAQEEYAVKNIKKDYKDSKAMNLSIGYGIESKFPVTQSVYFRLNGEFNFSFNIFKMVSENSNYTSEDYNTVSEDLKKSSGSLNNFRNMFLIGMGVGVLL